jgi:hypothetical protein
MCNSNKDLKKGRGNGTLCRFVSIKLKDGVILDWKNWDGRKVNTVSADVVEWVRFQHWPEPPRNVNRFFKLRLCQYTTIVKRLPTPGTEDVTVDIGNIVMHQLPVNSNIATTGHKLQGMSKLMMVVTEWGSFSNWIYVVLSRVTTWAGLFLLKSLTRRIESFVVSKELLDFERKMQELEDNFIARIELKL